MPRAQSPKGERALVRVRGDASHVRARSPSFRVVSPRTSPIVAGEARRQGSHTPPWSRPLVVWAFPLDCAPSARRLGRSVRGDHPRAVELYQPSRDKRLCPSAKPALTAEPIITGGYRGCAATACCVAVIAFATFRSPTNRGRSIASSASCFIGVADRCRGNAG